MKLRDFQRLLAPLRHRLQALVARGVWLLSYENRGMREGNLTLLAGETRDRVEHLEPYGFTSSPQKGAEVFVLSVGGNRDHCLAFCVADRRFRLRTLEAGEVALYDDLGKAIILHRDGSIEIRCPGGVDLRSDLRVDGDIVATGEVGDQAGTLQEFRDAYNLHTHPEHDGGSTGPPAEQV